MPVKQGDKVKVEYEGKLSDGQVFDKSKEGEPIEFTVGEHHVIPGFENAVVGMEINQEKTINLKKEEAYGDVKKELQPELPKTALPKDQEPKVGMVLGVKFPNGQIGQGRVIDIKEQTIVVDFNHPLAGKDLTFTLKVVGIN